MMKRDKVIQISMICLGILGFLIQVINIVVFKNHYLSWCMFGYAMFYFMLTAIIFICDEIRYHKEMNIYKEKIKELKKQKELL